MYKAFLRAKAGCDKWRDYEMTVAPYDKDKPIYYEFTACPAAEFAIRNGLTEIMPALCNVDFASMELLHARLVRTTTCANGCKCDYTICGDKDPYLTNTGTRLASGGTSNAFTGDSGRSGSGGSAGSCLRHRHPQGACWHGASLQPGGVAAVRDAGIYNTCENQAKFFDF